MVWLYDNPDTLNYDFIDEPIRDLIKRMNESGWMKTEESCCGHPAHESPWMGSTKGQVYIRFAVKPENIVYAFDMCDYCWENMSGIEGHVALRYDRKDEDGIHLFLYYKYGDISNRNIGIVTVDYGFTRANDMWNMRPNKE